MTTTAYKFLAKGARGPLSGFSWPTPSRDEPGSWVEAQGPLELCARGVHVCRTIDLPHWMHEELWELQTDGDSIDGVDCRVYRRARLLRRIDAWQSEAARFAAASIGHAHAAVFSRPDDTLEKLLADAKWAAREGFVAVSAYAAALAVAMAAGPSHRQEAYRAERVWQAHWIAREIIGVSAV